MSYTVFALKWRPRDFDEIIEIYIGYKENKKAAYHLLNLQSNYKDWISTDYHCCLTEGLALVYQYLTTEGYAVPLYIDKDHPGNGQTAIDLGIAVEE